MKPLYLVLVFVALTTAQKPHKNGKQGKSPAYHASSPGSSQQGGHYSDESPVPYNGQGHSQRPHSNYGSTGSGHGQNSQKQSYPLLLADTRTLNTDGTINFNFQADNGLQQGESVDADGTRRGFYSYPGADGKTITVKYTAGKNGFIAEGDHLPMQPQAAAASPEKDESYTPKQRHGRQEYQGQHDDGQYRQGQHDDGQYRPETYSSGGGSGSHHGRPSHSGSSGQYRPSAPSHFGGGGGHSSSPFGGGSHGGSGANSFIGFGGDSGSYQGFASPQTNYNDYAGPQSHGGGGRGGGGRPYGGSRGSGGGGHYSGAGRFPGGDSPSYSSFTGPAFGGGSGSSGSYNSLHSGSPSYSGASSPSFGGGSPGGGAGAGSYMFSNANPYQPSGAGPVNANFDLGNTGHFSINFNPGSAQEYNPGGDFGGHGGAGGHGGSQSYSGGGPGAGAGSHGAASGRASRGQY